MIVSGGGKIEASDRGISEPLRTKKQEVRLVCVRKKKNKLRNARITDAETTYQKGEKIKCRCDYQ